MSVLEVFFLSVDKVKSLTDFDVEFYETSIFDAAVTLACSSKVKFADYVRLLWYIVGYRHYRKRLKL